jgi:hypothetical protein
MKIHRKRLDAIRANAPVFGYKPRPVSIQGRVRSSTRKVRDDIRNNHSAALTLLEEAIRFVISFEDYQHFRDDRNKETVPFKFLLSRIRADLIAIHQLLMIGQETSALAVSRVFLEDIELTMATAIDLDFSNGYLDSSSGDAFWSQRVGYGKIYPLVEKFISHGASDSHDAKNHIQHHKQLKTFLSGHVHPSFSAALRTVLPPVLDRPGLFANRPLGWFGTNSARLCLYIADEIQTFSACCINMLVRADPPLALSGFKPDKNMAAFLLPAHTLQELTTRYSHRLHSEYEQRSLKWENACDGQQDEA